MLALEKDSFLHGMPLYVANKMTSGTLRDDLAVTMTGSSFIAANSAQDSKS